MKVLSLFCIGISLVFFSITGFAPDPVPQRNKEKFVVVLDAGHGGHDPGNLGNGYLEKNIALGIVLEAGKALKSDPDIEVVYTRKDDRFVDLYVRGEIANKAKADLFVSVHCDSHSSDANGAGTFVLGLHANKQNFEIAKKENSVIYLEDNYESRYAAYDINSPESIIGLTIMQEEFLDQSILLGKMMQDNFTNKLKRKNRKVKQAGFIVLHQTFMPSVLVETGFLTNKNEGSYLNSKKGQIQMGQAIAEAILQYKSNLWAESTAFEETGENVITSVPEVKAEPAKEVVAAIPVLTQVEKEASTDTGKETEIAEAGKETTKTTEEAANMAEAQKAGATAVLEAEKKPEAAAKEVIALESGVKEVATKESTKSPPVQQEITSEEKVGAEMKAAEQKKEAEQAVAEVKEKQPSSVKVEFRVQILASSREIPLTSGNFNGLSTISKEPYKNLYRYMYGQTNSYEQAKMLKSNADLKGYTTSFIVAYKEGSRIPMREAMKYISE
jgi:N-acetylmuramoyl-L-alanine amidase